MGIPKEDDVQGMRVKKRKQYFAKPILVSTESYQQHDDKPNH